MEVVVKIGNAGYEASAPHILDIRQEVGCG